MENLEELLNRRIREEAENRRRADEEFRRIEQERSTPEILNSLKEVERAIKERLYRDLERKELENLKVTGYEDVIPVLRRKWGMYGNNLNVYAKGGINEFKWLRRLGITGRRKEETGYNYEGVFYEVLENDKVFRIDINDYIGISYTPITVKELSDKASEVLGRETTTLPQELEKAKPYRIYPEVNTVDYRNNKMIIGFNAVFDFKSYFEREELPVLKVHQPVLIVEVKATEGFRTVTDIKYVKSMMTKNDVNFLGNELIKEENGLSIPFEMLKRYIDDKRDILKTDLVDLSDDEMLEIVKNGKLGDVF